MHNMHIVNAITKIATEYPGTLQDMIDLATLGYRDGLIASKVAQIVEDEQLNPAEVDVGDISPDEMNIIINDTENWFRVLMIVSARAMVGASESEQQKAAQEFLLQNNQASFADALPEAVFISPSNRVYSAIEDIMKENPGLFD